MTQSMLIIGISGASAAGKTFLTDAIIRALGSNQVAVISEDSYYKGFSHLPIEERGRINFDHPNAFDHEYLVEHLNALKQGKTIEVPTYNYTTHSRSKETKIVGPHKIVVLEGILLFADINVRPLLDIKFFIDTPLDICLMRRIRRDIEERGRTLASVFDQYERTVRPMFQEFIEPSKQYADLIIPNRAKNYIAVDLIKTKMQQILDSF
ncbi:uridine/cytidine kinase [Alphaproteobacteria bacterium]